MLEDCRLHTEFGRYLGFGIPSKGISSEVPNDVSKWNSSVKFGGFKLLSGSLGCSADRGSALQ
jgi:hypothetical protein